MSDYQLDIARVLKALTGEDVQQVYGKRFVRIRCPFHEDRTPSAAVNQFGFRCFSCGRYGDALKLIRDEEGLDFRGAIERASEIFGGEIVRDARPSHRGQRLPAISWA